MGRVPCDEDAVCAVLVGNCDTQVPKANVVYVECEFGADRGVQKGLSVECVAGRSMGNRRVKKPRQPVIDPSEKLPIAVEIGV